MISERLADDKMALAMEPLKASVMSTHRMKVDEQSENPAELPHCSATTASVPPLWLGIVMRTYSEPLEKSPRTLIPR